MLSETQIAKVRQPQSSLRTSKRIRNSRPTTPNSSAMLPIPDSTMRRLSATCNKTSPTSFDPCWCTWNEFVRKLTYLALRQRATMRLNSSIGPGRNANGTFVAAQQLSAPVAAAAPSVPLAPGGLAPTDLSTTHSGKRPALTPKEREYRFTNKLCLYCGQAGHRITTCPNRKTLRLQANDIHYASLPTSPGTVSEIVATPEESKN